MVTGFFGPVLKSTERGERPYTGVSKMIPVQAEESHVGGFSFI